jgi:class 3 adenylate cyclase
VRCAIEVQNAMVERNSGVPEESRIEFRIGVHLGDVVEEEDGDLMGDGVNIAARLQGVAKPGTICLSEDAYRQEADRRSGRRHFSQQCQQFRRFTPERIFSAGRHRGNETPGSASPSLKPASTPLPPRCRSAAWPTRLKRAPRARATAT